jgi:hypothetical protein
VIPVVPQPEPEEFDELVRKRGGKFLSKFTNSKPTSKQWSRNDYWNGVRTRFYAAYKGICAYSAHWIPLTANPNIDHYIPKSVNKNLAYEWSNYRLACALVNTLKGDHQDVADPFTLNNNSFLLDFPTLIVSVNPTLAGEEICELERTIQRLKLNSDNFVNDRSRWLEPYCLGEVDFPFLQRNAPFIAYELERQDLIDKIKIIMNYKLEVWE